MSLTKQTIEALKTATNNFETGFSSSTLMGWQEEYDEQGRLLYPNPNYKSGVISIGEAKYWLVRKGWKVRIWNRPADYMNWMNDKSDHIEELDITPDYLKTEKP